MSGRSKRCCATACHRGPRHRRSKTGCRLGIVMWSDAVRSDGGQQGQRRGGKPTWRTHDRLMHTTQTAWERPRDNIRKPGVRDPLWGTCDRHALLGERMPILQPAIGNLAACQTPALRYGHNHLGVPMERPVRQLAP